jgi:hypothetical protein
MTGRRRRALSQLDSLLTSIPSRFRRLCEGRCVEALCAGHKQLGGEGGDPAVLLVLRGRSGIDLEVDVDER